jgi:hypothetical protein
MPSSVEVDLVKRLRALAALRQHAVNTMPSGFMPPAMAKATADVGTLTEAVDRIEALTLDNAKLDDAAATMNRLWQKALERATVAEAALGEAREALEPFAEIGSWMFARPQVPDSEPVVTVHGINGSGWQLTRGMFKRAHLASTPTTAGQGDGES